MKSILSTLILLCVLATSIVQAQQKSSQVNQITGFITDENNTPIKGVVFYVDSIKTRTKSNKKGFYKLKVGHEVGAIAAYAPDYGIYSLNFDGQEELNFSFPSKSDDRITETDLRLMGFKSPDKPKKVSGEINFENDTEGFAGYKSVLELIAGRLAGVQVRGNRVVIRGGVNSYNGDGQALILVNGSQVNDLSGIPPSEVKSIKVVKGSDASFYGLRGANGVIEIKLK